MYDQYQYFVEEGPHSQWLYRKGPSQDSFWQRWSFSQIDWVYTNPYEKNPIKEINSDEAYRFVLDGYSSRAENYAKRAVYVHRI